MLAELEAEEAAAKAKQREEDEYKSEAEPHPDFAEFAESNADYSIHQVLLDYLRHESASKARTSPIPIESSTIGGEGAVGYGGYGDEYDSLLMNTKEKIVDDAMDVE